MLSELNKELIQELGVALVGDVIAIIKHAQKVMKADSEAELRKAEVDTLKAENLRLQDALRKVSEKKPVTPLVVAAVSKVAATIKIASLLPIAFAAPENRPSLASRLGDQLKPKPVAPVAPSISSRLGPTTNRLNSSLSSSPAVSTASISRNISAEKRKPTGPPSGNNIVVWCASSCVSLWNKYYSLQLLD